MPFCCRVAKSGNLFCSSKTTRLLTLPQHFDLLNAKSSGLTRIELNTDVSAIEPSAHRGNDGGSLLSATVLRHGWIPVYTIPIDSNIIYNSTIWQGLSLKYRFWMTNGPSDDIWFQHFSADEFCKSPAFGYSRLYNSYFKTFYFTDILHMLIGFLLAQVALSAVAIKCGSKRTSYSFFMQNQVIYLAFQLIGELKARQLLHSTYKMFITSVLLQAVGLFLLTIAYGKYANDGVGSVGLKTLGIPLFE